MKNLRLLTLSAIVLIAAIGVFAATGVTTEKTGEILPVKAQINQERPHFEGLQKLLPMGVADTLAWISGGNVNFGGWTGDYFAEYFVPAADGELHSITFDFSDLADVDGGGMTVWIYQDNYGSWSEIATDEIADAAAAWLGYYDTDLGQDAFGTTDQWVFGNINTDGGGFEGKIYDPLAAKAWPLIGGAAVSLPPNANDGGLVTLDLQEAMGSIYNFTQGDTFLVVIKFTGFPDGGGASEYRMGFLSSTMTLDKQPGLKFYDEIGNPSGRLGTDDWGWYIRSYVWHWECNVVYTGDRAPVISGVTQLATTLSTDPRTVTATVVDDNPSGGDYGVASVNLKYSVNGGAYQSVAMTDNGDGTYSADIPGQNPGATVTYYIEATDVMGLSSSSLAVTYSIFKATGSTLFVYDDDALTGLEWYYWYGADWDYGYDMWEAPFGGITSELLDNYEIVYHVMGGGPSNPIADIGTLYKDFMDASTADVPHRVFISGQDYGYISGYADTTFPAGTFENDYLGIETLGPQDINYDGTQASYTTTKYAIDPVSGDVLTGYLYDFAGDSLQLFYDPYYELGFSNWIDNLTPTSSATVCFTDPNQSDAAVAVHNEGTNWKTVFWPLDPLAISFYDPADTASMYHWVLTDVGNPLDVVLQWFGAPLSIEPVGNTVPEAYTLSQNFPNPFNPTTTIQYSIPEAGDVNLTIYNMLGQEVRTLVNKHQQANTYQVVWDGLDKNGNLVPSGVYFYSIKANDFTASRKMVYVK